MAVLDSAVAWWHADRYDPDTDTQWEDQSGNGHHAQLGSTSGADTNDPTFLPYDGTQYAVPAGPQGGSLNLNDGATGPGSNLDLSGDFDLIFRVHVNDLAPSVYNRLLDAYVSTGWSSDLEQIRLGLNSLGYLAVSWRTQDWPGTEQAAATCSALLSSSSHVTAGGSFWMRVKVDVDNGSGGSDVFFYTAADAAAVPTGWTQLGSTQTPTPTSKDVRGPLAGQTPRWRFGSSAYAADTNVWDGGIYRCLVYSGFQDTGTLEADIDFTDEVNVTPGASSFTEDSANAQTVTIYRGSLVEPLVVNRNLWHFAGDDFFSVQDHADLDVGTADDFTAYVVFRAVKTGGSAQVLLAKRGYEHNSQAGYDIVVAFTDQKVFGRISDGGGQSGGSHPTIIAPGEHGGGFALDRQTDITPFADGSPTTAVTDNETGSLANALALRFGVYGTSVNWYKGAIVGVALFRSLLSDADVATLHTELTSDQTPAPPPGGITSYLRILRSSG